jgi:hypothetical protein
LRRQTDDGKAQMEPEWVFLRPDLNPVSEWFQILFLKNVILAVAGNKIESKIKIQLFESSASWWLKSK